MKSTHKAISHKLYAHNPAKIKKNSGQFSTFFREPPSAISPRKNKDQNRNKNHSKDSNWKVMEKTISA